MYEFYFFAIKKLLGTYITSIATTCSLIALVSLKTHLQTIVLHWSACFLLADGQALSGWFRNGVSWGGGLDSKDTSG